MTKTILLAGREVPLEVIEEYIRFLRKPIRAQDIGGYDYERSRLHNAIFNVAGLPDKQFCKARIIGCGADRNDPEEKPYWEFNEALEDILCSALACSVCGTTLNRDQKCGSPRCANFGKHVSGFDNVKNLRKIAGGKR